MKIVTSSRMQEWEQSAFRQGCTPETLMREAVLGMATFWKKRFPQQGHAVFFCGKGNNGNDGLWLADELHRAGWETTLISSHSPQERKGPEITAIRNSLARAHVWPDHPEFPPANGPLILVDALLGIGAVGRAHGVYADILNFLDSLDRSGTFRISIDLPSGLDPETGDLFPESFRADLTLTLGAVKSCLLRDSARDCVGRIQLIPLSLPLLPDLHFPDMGEYFTDVEAAQLVRTLPASTHKHQRGSLAIWAGSPGMAGAAILSARAGLKAGAGLVRLFTHPEVQPLVPIIQPEIMTQSFPEDPLPENLMKAKAWVLGPGIGIHEDNLRYLKKLLSRAPCPVVLDADALRLAAMDLSMLKNCPRPLILTPHQGELTGLLGHSFTERSTAAKEWIRQYPGTVLVLKGPNTLVASSDSLPSHNASGNPGMASAGMGDVLSGILGSLLAQGYPPYSAARLGVFWHGLAADLAVAVTTEQTLTASDVVSFMAPAWKKLSGYPDT